MTISACAAAVVMPSPHSPSKTGVNALMVGETPTAQQARMGEGFAGRTPHHSSALRPAAHLKESLMVAI